MYFGVVHHLITALLLNRLVGQAMRIAPMSC